MGTKEMTVIQAAENAGVSKSKAEQIKKTFLPMSEMVAEFEGAYKKIVKVKKITPELCSDARVLRLKIAKIRTGTEKLRKQQKDEYVRAGKAIDGVANILKWAVKDKEDHLEEIENHFKRLEAEMREKLKEEREAELAKYDIDGSKFELGEMDETLWVNYLRGVELNYKEKVAEAKKAEEEKQAAIAKGKAEAAKKVREEKERQKKLKVENERLKKEAAQKEVERLADAKKLQDKLDKDAENQRKLDAENQKKLDKIKVENDKNAKIAQDALDKLKAKKEQEEAERARIIAEKKKAEQAPDIEKLKAFSDMLQGIRAPTVESQELLDVVLNAERCINEAIVILIKVIAK